MLRPQFDTPAQQHEAAVLGMWVFLATEVMLFGGLFTGLAAYRVVYPDVWAAASHHLDLWLGTANTGVLLTSSLFVALGVEAVRAGKARVCAGWLALAAALGVVFLGFKFLEYYHHYAHHLVPGLGFRWEGDRPDVAPLFFYFYFFMTGLHALHVSIGLAVLTGLAGLTWWGRGTPNQVEVGGLYWHLVDVIWIFLFPLLYLVGHR